MPRSQKPRGKKYRPIRPRVIMMTEEQYTHIIDWINRIVLCVEVTLPKGTCTPNDMEQIEDLFNWTNGILYQRYKKLDQQELDAVIPTLTAGRSALNAIFDRQLEGKTAGFVGTGDELKAIHAAFLIIRPLLKEAIRLAPVKTLNEFLWANKLAERKYKERQRNEKINA